MVFLGGAAPSHDLGHAGHGQQAPLNHPILDGAQSGQAVSRWTFDLVAQNFTDQTGGLNLRLHAIGQVDVGGQVVGHLGQGKEIVHSVLEGNSHKGQTVKRGGTDVLNAGRRGQTNFHLARVIAFHFFG